MRNKRNNLFILVVISTLFSISGCVKKDAPSQITQVLLVPLSPNAPAIDFVINGVTLATTIGYSSTVGTTRYSLPYYTIPPKAGSVVAYNLTGTKTALSSGTKDLEEDKVYSTFLIDSFSKAKTVMVNDDLTDPTPGKVKIRFFHFSPNTPALDVVNMGATAKIFAARSFNDQAATPTKENFIEIDPGNYTFLFNDAATGATLYTTTLQSLLPDRIYTLAARGFTGGAANQALGAWVYPNKP